MIVSRQNRKIKTIRRLRRCKGEKAILEGPHLIEDAVGCDIALEEVLATPEFMQRPEGRRIERLLSRTPLLVDPRILDELADADSPRGVIAVSHVPRGGVDTLPAVADGVIVLAEAIQDPGNLGALARSVEAAGGTGLALTTGSVHPNHPRALRASAGALLRLPVAIDVELPTLLKRLDLVRPQVVALAAHGGTDLYSLDAVGPQVLIIGAEGPGVSEEMLDAADQRVTIPLLGKVESLNTAVAAAVALFEISRRRSAAVRPRPE